MLFGSLIVFVRLKDPLAGHSTPSASVQASYVSSLTTPCHLTLNLMREPGRSSFEESWSVPFAEMVRSAPLRCCTSAEMSHKAAWQDSSRTSQVSRDERSASRSRTRRGQSLHGKNVMRCFLELGRRRREVSGSCPRMELVSPARF